MNSNDLMVKLDLQEKSCPLFRGASKEEIVDFYRLVRSMMFFDVYHEELDSKLFEAKYQKAKEIFLKFREKGSEESFETFISSLPQIKELLNTDVEAIYEGDPAARSIAEVIVAYPGFLAISAHRIAHVLLKMGYPFEARVISEYAHSRTGIDIHPGADIGPYFFIDHGTGIVIGETTKIGEHVKIYQGVTLGALSLKEGRALLGKKRHPTIEDGVTIYSGASILGGDTIIGKDSVIGSNAFITSSLEPNSKVKIRLSDLDIK